MTFLENRIPPPLVLLLALILIKGVSMLSASRWEAAYLAWLGILLAVAGFTIAFLGVREFRKAQTTVNPLDPSRASKLVTSGVFAFTRNPMYLGMLFVAAACAIYLGSPLSFIVVVLFALYINRFQIEPEERAIRKLFGADFDTYCARTSRWL